MGEWVVVVVVSEFRPALEASLDDSTKYFLTQSKLKPTIIDQLINPRKDINQSYLFTGKGIYIYI